MADDAQVIGGDPAARFSLKLHRGEGMVLIAMDWRDGPPPSGFVGFAIECRPPGGAFTALRNSFTFADRGSAAPADLSTLHSPIQKFRWVHFPQDAEQAGDFTYRVTPVMMDAAGDLAYDRPQQAAIVLRRETHPGLLNVAFTRGFVSSQAFVRRFATTAPVSTLLPAKAVDGLSFTPTHPRADEALAWMGFEARQEIYRLLDQAIADPLAKVLVTAYDLCEPGIVSRLERLGSRLRIIIDDSGEHGAAGSPENEAARRCALSAGAGRVKRQHLSGLQHNKTIVVDGPAIQAVVCGSTNFSWRGFYVQSNNALVLHGPGPVRVFAAAFEGYWTLSVSGFGRSASAHWQGLGLAGIDAQVAFSPHGADNRLLPAIAGDLAGGTTSSLFYSLAFLHQTVGPIRDAIRQVSADERVFVYGMSDSAVGGLELQKPNGNVAPVHPAALDRHAPEPFVAEPVGGSGIRMHHKFLVLDFDKPTARVYTGSYNFSGPADTANGENLLLIRDRRVAVAYMVEALRLFDHYHFRIAQQEAGEGRRRLELARPPRGPQEEPWWAEYYRDPVKIRDRRLFA